jgi:predicted ATPase
LVADNLSAFDSMMTQVADPRNAPEMLVLRESIRAWRFYDHFRTDADAPARLPQIGTRTPILGNDGADLAAAVQKICEIGEREALVAAVADAFQITTYEVRELAPLFFLTRPFRHLLVQTTRIASFRIKGLRNANFVSPFL